MVREKRWLVALALAGLGGACADSKVRGDSDSIGTSISTGGPAPTDSGEGTSAVTTAGSQTTVPTATSTSASASAGTGGIKLDVAGDFDVGDDTGGAIPPSCDNIEDFPDTSVGCEFWGVQVPSYASSLPYGISVGNPGEEIANVVIEDLRGAGGTLREIVAFTVDPKGSELTAINGTGGLLPGSHMVSANGLTETAAFRVTSDVPVTAMQIFPVGGGPSHVSEASLLLPINALDTAYIGLGYPNTLGGNGFVTVVATQDATTINTTQGDVMLDAFDAWTYAVAEPTGFFVGADKEVAVFSGVECTLIPGQPWYACDHLEEQLVPLATWGQQYVAPRHPQRVPDINSQPEDVHWRVVAAADATTVTLDPPVAMGGNIALAALGDWVEFTTADSFTASSDQPFMLVQYMSGCYNVIDETGQPGMCDQGPTGDPYMIQVPPIEQWLTSLPFLTDTSYPRDFVMLMREQGTSINLECLGLVPDDHFTPITGTSYEVGYVDLDVAGMGGEGACVDGAQFLSADGPIGVMVAGLDWATSYGYPGGMSLGSLWVPPQEPPE